MFLEAYWYGQILDYSLHITMISEEKGFQRENQLYQYRYFATSNLSYELLRAYIGGLEFGEVYFYFDSLETYIRHGDFLTKIEEDRSYIKAISNKIAEEK